MADLKAFAEQLVNLTVKEGLAKDCLLYTSEPAAAAVAVAAGPAAGGAAAAEEKTSFDVVLKNGIVERRASVGTNIKMPAMSLYHIYDFLRT